MRHDVRRRPTAWAAAAAVALATVGAAGGTSAPARAAVGPGPVMGGCRSLMDDAIHRRTLSELDAWTGWLSRGGVPGYVGEFGWPDGGDSGDADRWDCLAEAWYARADAAGLHATTWLTTERRSHDLAVYETTAPGQPLTRPGRQAAVVERHRSTRTRLRGVNASGAEDGFGNVGPSALTAQRPGTPGVTHAYPSAATWRYLAGRGTRLVRLPLRWERLQPRLGAPLDPAETARLLASVDAARAAGLTVVVDLHNYGGYWVDGPDGTPQRLRLGDPALTVGRFADVWLRLAGALGRRDRVVLGLMNEPVALEAPGRDGVLVWERASREVVRALRARGHRNVVAVGGYRWSSLAEWPGLHRRGPWVDDPLDRVWYEAHHYWDLDRSSTYDHDYDHQVRLLSR